jgi:hypothetical protein
VSLELFGRQPHGSSCLQRCCRLGPSRPRNAQEGTIKITTFYSSVLSPQGACKSTNAEISPSNYFYFFLDVHEEEAYSALLDVYSPTSLREE